MMDALDGILTIIAYGLFLPFIGHIVGTAGRMMMDAYDDEGEGKLLDWIRRYGLLAATGLIVVALTPLDF